jgi:hypothetical protein
MNEHAARAEIIRAACVLDRRSFLKISLGLATAGLGSMGCRGVAPELAPPPGTALSVLGPRSYATFTAAAMRIVGPAGAAMIAARRIDAGTGADRWLARTPALAGPVSQALMLLEIGLWPLVAKVRPFTALEGDAQDRVLVDLMESRLDLKRAVYQGVRALAMLSVYSAPESRVLSSYPGPFGNDRVSIRAGMI